MSDLVKALEGDPQTLALLASLNSPRPSLAELTARGIVRARGVEEERQRRRREEDERWARHQDEVHRRAMAPPPPAKATPRGVTIDELQSVLEEIGRRLGGELAGLEKRITASQHLDGDPWSLRTRYQPGQIVKYRGYSWRCICAGSGLAPDKRPNHWEPYGAAPPADTNLADPDLAALEQRLAAVEARPAMKYQGVFDETKSYTEGDNVTHDGQLYVCRSACCGVKPLTSSAWQLAVKRGRDARDRR